MLPGGTLANKFKVHRVVDSLAGLMVDAAEVVALDANPTDLRPLS